MATKAISYPQLEQEGFVCTKAGASLGMFDVIAIGPTCVRCLQVKAGTARVSREEREAIAALAVPANVTKELWTCRDRQPVRVDVL